MRLWSLHPRYLDRQGLTAAWREALLAQAVLAGRTRGYTRHPQLLRFQEVEDPPGALGAFLSGLHEESLARGYRFDLSLIDRPLAEAASAHLDATGETSWAPIPVTDGQVRREWAHLMAKLEARSPETARRWRHLPASQVGVHPLFVIVPGPVAGWEQSGPTG